MAAASYRLLKLLETRPERMGLALLALAVSKEFDPAVDVAGNLQRMVTLADEVCATLPPTPATGDLLYALNSLLFDELDFGCATVDAPPFVHRLMEERRGDALAFAILYVTLGRLLNLPLEYVALSGRLLARVADGDEENVIDPCAGGVVLTHGEVQTLLTRAVGTSLNPMPRYRAFLAPMDDRAVMVRLLRRYKEFFLAHGQYEEALLALEMTRDVAPELGAELLEHGRLLERLHRHEAAAADYLHYLERHPDGEGRDDLRQRTHLLLSNPSSFH